MNLQDANGNWQVELTFSDFMGMDAFIEDIKTIKLYNEPDSTFEVHNSDGLNKISRSFRSFYHFEDWHDNVDSIINTQDVPNSKWVVNYVEEVVKENDLLKDKQGNKMEIDNITLYNNEKYFIYDVIVGNDDKGYLLLRKLSAKSEQEKIDTEVCVTTNEVIYTKLNKWESKDFLNNYILNEL